MSNHAKISKFIKSFNINKYLTEHNFVFKSTQGDKPQLQLEVCPFCGSKNYKGHFHPYRFYMDEETKLFTCYNCSKKGYLISFLAEIENLTVPQVFDKYISKEFYEQLPTELKYELDDELQSLHQSKDSSTIKTCSLPKEFIQLTDRLHKDCLKGYQYLAKRGMINMEILRKMDIRFTPYYEAKRSNGNSVRLYNRIVFPIVFKGEVVGWQARETEGSSNMKYYIQEGFEKQKILYNYDNIKDAETITICEGLVDVYKCFTHNPTCLFGKSISQAQLNLLFGMKNLKNIIIAIDPDTKLSKDSNGVSSYEKLVNELYPFFNIYEINIDEDKDCGDYSLEEMSTILDKATPYFKGL